MAEDWWRELGLADVASSERPAGNLDFLLRRVASGDDGAFAELYDASCARVYGLILRVVRDPAHSEEVAQEVFVEVWRTATRFDPVRGSALSWLLMVAHRRAVDRVRAVQSSTDRDKAVGVSNLERPFDEVSESVADTLERQAVRRCLNFLTVLQREAISLAYYQGYTYREVAQLLQIALPTIKTRMRDGLIRLRDCLGVAR